MCVYFGTNFRKYWRSPRQRLYAFDFGVLSLIFGKQNESRTLSLEGAGLTVPSVNRKPHHSMSLEAMIDFLMSKGRFILSASLINLIRSILCCSSEQDPMRRSSTWNTILHDFKIGDKAFRILFTKIIGDCEAPCVRLANLKRP